MNDHPLANHTFEEFDIDGKVRRAGRVIADAGHGYLLIEIGDGHCEVVSLASLSWVTGSGAKYRFYQKAFENAALQEDGA